MRDPRGLGYGTYRLVDTATGNVYAHRPPTGYGLTLEQVEATPRRWPGLAFPL
jgi:hypothetical protein